MGKTKNAYPHLLGTDGRTSFVFSWRDSLQRKLFRKQAASFSSTSSYRTFNMLNLTDYGRLKELTKLTDKMVNDASKEALADAARILAVQIGHYQRKFGVLPVEEAVE